MPGESGGPIAGAPDLGSLVVKVTDDYRKLALKKAPNEARDAAAYHAACKAALAHLDLLLKVASSPRVPDRAADGPEFDEAVHQMIARARDTLAEHPEAEE